MDCGKYKDLFAGRLAGTLKLDEQQTLEQHLSGCDACREELADMEQIWKAMAQIPQPRPSVQMDMKFEAMLKNYQLTGQPQQSLLTRLANIWHSQPRWPLAYTLVFVLTSFTLGYVIFHKPAGDAPQLKELSAQVHELKQTMMLALLENPVASERIKGVSYTSEIKSADKELTDALLVTLNNDPNVNVRLATLDALAHLAAHPEVREGLIRSIPHQNAPSMQYAIADLMLKLQERQSVGPFKDLLKQKKLDNGVRNKIQQTINSLI